MPPRDPQDVLIERGGGSRHRAHHFGRIAPPQEQLLHGSTLSLLEEEGAQLAQVRDRPYHGETVPIVLGSRRQRPKQFERLSSALVAIDLEVAAQRFAP